MSKRERKRIRKTWL